MELKDKLRAGSVHHYGTAMGNCCHFLARSLLQDIKSGRINLPDFSSEQLRLIKKSVAVNNNLTNEERDQIPCAREDHLVSYASSFFLYAHGTVCGKESPHPLITHSYLNDIAISPHLRRGLVVVRAHIDAFRKLYALKEYWVGIPRDADTEPFYVCADIFSTHISKPFQALDDAFQETKQAEQGKVLETLDSIHSIWSHLNTLGDEIRIMQETLSKEGYFAWNLADIDPSIAMDYPSTEELKFRYSR